MFDLDAVSLSTHERSGAGHLARRGRRHDRPGAGRLRQPSGWTVDTVAFAVGGYITAAYWFTSSTSFANPAVTVARTLSDTFAGIAPSSAAGVRADAAGRRSARARAGRVPVRQAARGGHAVSDRPESDRPTRPVRVRAQRRPLADGSRPPDGPGRRPGRRALRRLAAHRPGQPGRGPGDGGGGHRHRRRPSRRCSPRTRCWPPTWWSRWAAATSARSSPGKRYEDWVLDDPAGQGIEAVRPIRDEIRRRVEGLD